MLDALEACSTAAEMLAVLDSVTPDTETLAEYLRAGVLGYIDADEVLAGHCNQHGHVPGCDKEDGEDVELSEEVAAKIREALTHRGATFKLSTLNPNALSLYGINEHEKRIFHILFTHDAVSHALKNHGNPTTESARGQIAVVVDDFLLFPRIVNFPDSVVPAKQNGKMRATGLNGEPRFEVKKAIDGIVYTVIVEKKAGKQGLAPVTLYKHRAKK